LSFSVMTITLFRGDRDPNLALRLAHYRTERPANRRPLPDVDTLVVDNRRIERLRENGGNEE
jgi:hypothetical protein